MCKAPVNKISPTTITHDTALTFDLVLLEKHAAINLNQVSHLPLTKQKSTAGLDVQESRPLPLSLPYHTTNSTYLSFSRLGLHPQWQLFGACLMYRSLAR